MVGLTRFFSLMNVCEKNGIVSNVYRVFVHFKKDANFEGVKKDFVLQGFTAFCECPGKKMGKRRNLTAKHAKHAKGEKSFEQE